MRDHLTFHACIAAPPWCKRLVLPKASIYNQIFNEYQCRRPAIVQEARPHDRISATTDSQQQQTHHEGSFDLSRLCSSVALELFAQRRPGAFRPRPSQDLNWECAELLYDGNRSTRRLVIAADILCKPLVFFSQLHLQVSGLLDLNLALEKIFCMMLSGGLRVKDAL